MRMAELSHASGVPVATIKFYVRDGLLPAGVRTSANQAQYRDSHVRRLRLIQTLLGTGLSIKQLRTVLATIDDGRPDHSSVASAVGTVRAPRAPGVDDQLERARVQVARLIEDRQWRIQDGSDAAASLTGLLASIGGLGIDLAGALDVYADAAAQLAQQDVADATAPTEQHATRTVVRILLSDALMASLHQLALENLSAVSQT